MKKVFSSLGLIFFFPIRVVRRWSKDNFVAGLIFGAVFSLVVNIVTVQIQEVIQKQRILEAIENEVVNNTLRANTVAEQNLKNVENNVPYNPFYFIRRYSRDLWEQSSEPLQYIAQLDQDTQIALNSYYAGTIPFNNGMLGRLENLTYEKLADCSPIGEDIQVNESDYCKQWNGVMLDSERSVAEDVSARGFELLKKFHPTKDRRNSWFLRLIMGDKSTRILSGE